MEIKFFFVFFPKNFEQNEKERKFIKCNLFINFSF